jgi:hypothetical protein
LLPGQVALPFERFRRARLVDTIERGGVLGDIQARTDAEAVHRRAICEKLQKQILVEVAAAENPRFLAAARVQYGAHAAGKLIQIAAVEAYALDRDPSFREPRFQRDDFSRRSLGIVRIDQQHGVPGL